MPAVDSRTIIRKVKAEGWELLRIIGSHHHFKHPDTPTVVTVPRPRKDVPIGTIKSIERQSNIKLR